MEELRADTLGDIYRILNSPLREKLVRDNIKDGDPELWEMTDPKTLVGNIRLVAAAEKAKEEAGEGVQATWNYITDPSEANRRKILREIADQREALIAVMGELGITEEEVLSEMQMKRYIVGEFGEFIFMKSERR